MSEGGAILLQPNAKAIGSGFAGKSLDCFTHQFFAGGALQPCPRHAPSGAFLDLLFSPAPHLSGASKGSSAERRVRPPHWACFLVRRSLHWQAQRAKRVIIVESVTCGNDGRSKARAESHAETGRALLPRVGQRERALNSPRLELPRRRGTAGIRSY
jgi:hypothetical protein